MRLLYGQSEAVSDWVAKHIPFVAERMHEAAFGQAFGSCKATGIIDETGFIVGGVVYHNWDPRCRSIEMSVAADTPRWLTRPLIGALLHYPMADLKCRRVSAVTAKRSRRCRSFLEGLGFRREGVARLALGDDDAVLYAMLDREWARNRFNPATR